MSNGFHGRRHLRVCHQPGEPHAIGDAQRGRQRLQPWPCRAFADHHKANRRVRGARPCRGCTASSPCQSRTKPTKPSTGILSAISGSRGKPLQHHAVRHHARALRRDAGREHVAAQHLRHRQHGIGAAPDISFRRPRQPPQSQPAMLFALLGERRIHLEEKGHRRAFREPGAGQEKKIVALVDQVRPQLPAGPREAAIRRNIVGQLGQLRERPGQEPAQQKNQPALAAEAGLRVGARADHHDLVARARERRKPVPRHARSARRATGCGGCTGCATMGLSGSGREAAGCMPVPSLRQKVRGCRRSGC